MAIQYLKKSPKTSSTDDNKTRDIVQKLLNELENAKEEGCKELTKKFDKYEGEIIVSKEKIEEIKKNSSSFLLEKHLESYIEKFWAETIFGENYDLYENGS